MASFMRPDGSHGLGDRFLRAFLIQSIAEIRESGEEPRCHPLDIDLVDLSRARVEREWSFSNSRATLFGSAATKLSTARPPETPHRLHILGEHLQFDIEGPKFRRGGQTRYGMFGQRSRPARRSGRRLTGLRHRYQRHEFCSVLGHGCLDARARSPRRRRHRLHRIEGDIRIV